MEHIVKRTTRLDIDIDTKNKSILVIQRWKYNWLANGFPVWSYNEKQKMHQAFEKEMDITWNRKARLKPVGSSPFAKKHKNDVFRLSFDIKWVVANEHWTVDVSKVASRDFKHRPNVNWNIRKIQLYTVDIENIRKYLTPALYQKNISHEFGHAIGNSSSVVNMHADEYNSKSPYFSDKASLMNVGMELRQRHFDYILREINTMFPNTNFTLAI